MWPGRTPHVVVGTLKISLDRLKNHKRAPICFGSNNFIFGGPVLTVIVVGTDFKTAR